MEKLLEVREYDSITGNADFIDNEKYKYLHESAFHELIEFIHEFAGDEENSDALEFMKIGYKRNVGEVVTIKNYVGLIQMKNGFQIQILPKIDLGDDEDTGNQETKRIFLKMLRSMKDFPGKAFNNASLRVDKMNLYELFINMYLQEVRQLVKHGLPPFFELCYEKGMLVEAEDVHHKKKLSDGVTHDRKNLVVLCKLCHSRIYVLKRD